MHRFALQKSLFRRLKWCILEHRKGTFAKLRIHIRPLKLPK